MALVVDLAISGTARDTSNVPLNSNITNYLQLALTDYAVDARSGNGFTLAVGGNKTITPEILNTSGGTRIQGVLVFTYTTGETAPEVEITVDGVVTTAGHVWAATFTTSLVIDAHNCVSPVAVQAFFYEMF